MKRKHFLFLLAIILFGCVTKKSADEKIIELSDGKNIKVSYEEKEIRKNERILILNYQVDERILKEKSIEKQVLEIWKKFEEIANERRIDEGLISSKYFVGTDEKTDEPIYEVFLFDTEKIENGTWKIRKLN